MSVITMRFVKQGVLSDCAQQARMSIWKLSEDRLTTNDNYIRLIHDAASCTDDVLKRVALHIP